MKLNDSVKRKLFHLIENYNFTMQVYHGRITLSAENFHTHLSEENAESDIVQFINRLEDPLSHSRKVRERDHLMTIEEFKNTVAEGYFNCDDGFGHYSDGENIFLSFPVSPGDTINPHPRFTHIVWYNK